MDYDSVEGMQQGASCDGSTGFIIGVQEIFARANATLQAAGGVAVQHEDERGSARAIADDLALVGPPDLVYAVYEDVLKELAEIGLELVPKKCKVYSPSGVVGTMPEGFQVGVNAPPGFATTASEAAKTGQPLAAPARIGNGVTLGGVPVGDDVYKCNYASSKCRRIRGLLQQPSSMLRGGGFLDEAFAVHRLSLARRADFLAQVVPYGTPGVAAEFRLLDDALRAQERETHGVECYDVARIDAPSDVAAAIAKRVLLPVRLGGLGLPPLEHLWPAAWWGMLEMVVPALSDRRVSEPDPTRPGQRVDRLLRGLAPHLVRATGDRFGEDGPRYCIFLQSGLAVARLAQEAWDFMRAEVGADDEVTSDGSASVLGVSAEYAGGSRMAAGEDVESSPEHPRFQRRLSSCRARFLAGQVDEAFWGLDTSRPAALLAMQAWRNRPPLAVFSSVPDAGSALGARQWRWMVPTLLGLPVPELAPHVGHAFTDCVSNAAWRARAVTAYGGELSLFMGKGNGRAGMSKAVELFCLGIAREAGVKASNQPFHLFSKYIDQRRRAEYESVALLQSRGMHFQQSGNNCGAVVVDLYLQGVSDPGDADVVQDRCYDVKTVGQRKDRYSLSAHVRAADKIEDVRAEYDRKARSADARWNGCHVDAGKSQAIPPGPVQQAVRALEPPVQGCGVGTFGEIGKGLSEYVTLIAAHAARKRDATVPGGTAYYRRFGLCHGEVQARGAIQGYFRRRLARVTVREAIDVRLRALDVVLGRVPPQTEEWLEADARLADLTSTAWDVRAHLSCPVPAC